MPMCVEYCFVLLLVLSKYLLYQCFVLFRSRWFSIARQVLPEVDKYS